jgi:site-specific DNA-methyltransferase (adenine-specific)
MNISYNADWRSISEAYPDNYFDLLIADIPYGIGVTKMKLGGTKGIARQKNGSIAIVKKSNEVFSNSHWDSITPTQEYFDEMKRVSKHQIIFGIEYTNWEGVGSGRIDWNKGVPDGMSFATKEVAYCSMINHTYELDLLYAGMQQAKSLSEPMVANGNKALNEKKIHPCHKPILLYDKLFLEFGFKGMKVIDPYLGSGSSRISADKFGVSEFVGCEIDPIYFEAEEQRWKQYSRQLKLNFYYS